jgi:hypothetical protein
MFFNTFQGRKIFFLAYFLLISFSTLGVPYGPNILEQVNALKVVVDT